MDEAKAQVELLEDHVFKVARLSSDEFGRIQQSVIQLNNAFTAAAEQIGSQLDFSKYRYEYSSYVTEAAKPFLQMQRLIEGYVHFDKEQADFIADFARQMQEKEYVCTLILRAADEAIDNNGRVPFDSRKNLRE